MSQDDTKQIAKVLAKAPPGRYVVIVVTAQPTVIFTGDDRKEAFRAHDEASVKNDVQMAYLVDREKPGRKNPLFRGRNLSRRGDPHRD